jgi:hypothetical protein
LKVVVREFVLISGISLQKHGADALNVPVAVLLEKIVDVQTQN